MTVRNIIEQAYELLSHRIEKAVLYAWLNELELTVQVEYLGIARKDAVQYSEQDGDAFPIIEGVFERMYSYWLLSKGHFSQQNHAQALRFRRLFESEKQAYLKWLMRTHGTGDAMGRDRGAYLSAYGIACKHGFVGSEQEWLASLRGQDGADGARGPRGQAGKDGGQYELQYDSESYTLRLMRDGKVVNTFDLTQRTSLVRIEASQTEYTFASRDAGEITYTWSTTAGGKGRAVYTVNDRQVAVASVEQGEVTAALGAYLQLGVNRVSVSVRDAYGAAGLLEFTVTVVSIGISSSFSASLPFSGDITYRYTPTGACEKTVYFIVDGKQHGTVTTSVSGRQLAYVIPALSHGHHILQVYACCTLGDREMYTETLYYDLMCIEQGNNTVIIASDFHLAAVDQYSVLSIPFTVYVPGGLQAYVQVYEDDVLKSTLKVDSTPRTYEYVCRKTGEHSVTLRCDTVMRTFTFDVRDAGIEVSVEQIDLALWLDAKGRSNSEQAPAQWKYTNVAGEEICAEFSGFGWIGDGWMRDEAGCTALRVPPEGYINIPIAPFDRDLRVDGLTVEVILATRNVDDYESVVLDCFTNRGLEIRARQARLESEQSEVLCSFAEEQCVHLCFVIEPQNEQRLIHVYINGVDSGVLQYPEDDSFTQAQPSGILIGSADCAVDLYAVRVYRAALSRHAVVDNFIASAPDPVEMATRYRRNCVYDEYGRIVPASLPAHLPYLIVESDALPGYKGDKKICSGSFTDASDAARSFTFSNAVIDVQGTSSQYYDTKNFKIAFEGGFVGSDGITRQGYALDPDGIATHTFCFKADVASSEGANNVKLVDLYCGACPFETAAQKLDSRVRQGIDGKPILLFWRNAVTGEVRFWGKYNFNHDKSTPEVFGFDREKFPRQQSWEFRNNTSDRVLFKSANFSGNAWKNDFEARFPEDYDDPGDLARVIGWVASCNPDGATEQTLSSPYTADGVTHTKDTAAYRLAKFKSEAAEYFDLTDLLWYYLFTELFLMIDSRAKNMFLTTDDGLIWYFLPYDFDTALGINNEGQLRFGYDLEDVDHIGEGDVFNGQDSVLWNNVRKCFANELRDMYAAMRTATDPTYIGKREVLDAFEAHQRSWGEAVFNEDCYKKYLSPLKEKGDASYLPMVHGSKSAQRAYWVNGRFGYLDSKYTAGDMLADHAVIRGYAKQDMTLTPYTGMYPTVKFGSYLVQKHAKRGERVVLTCPLDHVNDTEIIIYGASCMTDLGDLSGFYPGYADLSCATRLVELRLGSGEIGYSNPNLTSLSLGNNRMLRVLDVQNCPALEQALTLEDCPNIREVYAQGSGIVAISLPAGSGLRRLHLPATLHTLSIKEQPYLQEFSIEGCSQLLTLRLDNVPIDALPILAGAPLLERVRLTGVNWELEDMELLHRLAYGEIKGILANGAFSVRPVVSGTAYVAAELSETQYEAYSARLPDLTLIITLGIMDSEGAFIKDNTGAYIMPLA